MSQGHLPLPPIGTDTTIGTHANNNDETAWCVASGHAAGPGGNDAFTDQDLYDVVAYLRALD